MDKKNKMLIQNKKYREKKKKKATAVSPISIYIIVDETNKKATSLRSCQQYSDTFCWLMSIEYRATDCYQVIKQ